MKKIIVLGCSGSIGKSTLAIVREFPQLFSIVGLQANTNEKFLLEAAKEFNCDHLCLSGIDLTADVLNSRILYYGNNSIKSFIENTDADIVVNGISGASGLLPSVIALESGKDLALANKESMVMAGNIIKQIAKKNNRKILPVDSEHSAIFSLIKSVGKENIDSIIITASGGAFKNYTKEQLSKVTVKDALQHPTWSMGPKITIDSATLANKGLEVIEAYQLFGISPEKIIVTIHPQSLVHSLVQTKDGVLYAQISKPDMRHPILSALSYPQLFENSLEKIDFSETFDLQFSKPRFDDFPMLKYAYEVLNLGNSYSIAYNAANEIAVGAFRKNEISFTDISKVVKKIINMDWNIKCKTIEDVLMVDNLVRIKAAEALH